MKIKLKSFLESYRQLAEKLSIKKGRILFGRGIESNLISGLPLPWLRGFTQAFPTIFLFLGDTRDENLTSSGLKWKLQSVKII